MALLLAFMPETPAPLLGLTVLDQLPAQHAADGGEILGGQVMASAGVKENLRRAWHLLVPQPENHRQSQARQRPEGEAGIAKTQGVAVQALGCVDKRLFVLAEDPCQLAWGSTLKGSFVDSPVGYVTESHPFTR